MADRPDPAAAAVVARLVDLGLTVATGESLTGGLVTATLAQVPGCSAVLRGGIVAYQRDVKAGLLDVPESALAQGLVSEAVASAMARGAAARLAADVGIGTTGVAGPEPHDGVPVGSVWIAVCVGQVIVARHLSLAGDREQIRCQTAAACFELLAELLSSAEVGVRRRE